MQKYIQSDFVQKIGETFLVRVALILLGMITSIIVARSLGPIGRGELAAATTVGALGSQFGNLGLHASNTYFVAKDRKILPTLIGNTLFVSFSIGGIVSLVTWLSLTIFRNIAPVSGLLLVLVACWAPFDLANLLLQNLLLGLYKVRSFNIVQLSSRIFSLILLCVAAYTGRVTPTVAFAVGFAGLLVGIYLAFLELAREMQQPIRIETSVLKRHISYGIRAYLAALFSFLVLRADLLIVQYILGNEQLGYYALAVTVADLIYMLPTVIGSIMFPRLSALEAGTQKLTVAHRVAIATGLVSAVGSVLLVPVAPFVIGTLYGTDFLGAVPALLWLLPGIIFLSINTIYMNYFGSVGMPLVTVYSPAIAAILNLLANLLLTPELGIVGASLASTFAYCTMLMISLVYIWNKRNQSSNEHLP